MYMHTVLGASQQKSQNMPYPPTTSSITDSIAKLTLDHLSKNYTPVCGWIQVKNWVYTV